MINEHSKYYGPLMMLGAAICFSGGGLAMKIVPWNALAINGVRNMIACLVIILYMRFSGHRLRINKTVIFGAICLAGVTTLFTMANKMTTAGNAIILQYAVPIWIIIMMYIFFQSKPSKLDLCTILVVLVGILCFFIDSLSAGHILGDILAVLAGVFYGGVFIINQFEDGDALSSVMLGQLACGICLGPLVLKESDFSMPTIAAILFLGVVQVGIAYILFSEGTKYTHPVTASLIDTVEPILNPIWVAIFWGEVLKPLSLVGAAIVIIAVLLYNILKVRNTSQENNY